MFEAERVGFTAPPGVTVLGELGRGARAVVYRVRREGREWAMKVFPAVHTGGGPEFAALRREAAILAWLDHPVLPKVYEVGVAGRRPYLVMELVEGRSLAEVLRVRPLSVPMAVALGVRVAGALAALHAAGLVHRDVKPDNILVQPDGAARLVDLGMVVRATDEVAGEAAGTLRYAAPEQAGVLHRPVDARSDLYGLGCVLFECLAGTPPFTSDDVGELLRAHASVVPPDLRARRAEVPGTLAAVVAKLLAKDPDDRYRTAGALMADLARLTEDPAAAFPVGAADDEAPVPDAAPLVGRDEELAQLVDRWRRARAGRGGFAVVYGVRGAGKSRLLREVARRVRQDGGAVLAAGCPEHPLPLAPLRAALGPALDGSPDAEAATRALADALLDAAGDAGALLCLDDAHRVDEASLAVLRELATRVDAAPLLVLLAMDGDPDRAALPPVLARRAGPLLTLGPLDEAGAAALLAALARDRGLDDGLLARLAARAGTTPFEIQEYLAAVIDAGALVPFWGQWCLDVAGLDRIALPGDLRALLNRRLDGLRQPCRDLLAAAAVIGAGFDAGTAGEAAGVTAGTAGGLLAEAAARGVVQRQGDGYAFVHEQLRAAVLDAADPALLRDAHQRLAELLDATRGDPYALARHYLNGHVNRAPARVVAVCRRAGELALAANAPGQAAALLEPAHQLARRWRMPPGVVSAVGELLGRAYRQEGRLGQAVEVLTAALPDADGALPRAGILLEIGRIHQDTWDPDAGLAAMHQALAELGRRLPRSRRLLFGSTLPRFLAGLAVERTGIGLGTARGEARDRLLLEAELYRSGGIVASLGLDPLLAVSLLLRSLYPVARLGVTPEYARVRADVTGVLDLVGLGRLAGGYNRATRAAWELGDEAYVSHTRAMVAHLNGRRPARDILADTGDPDHRIDTGAFVTTLGGTLWLLLLAGFTGDARALYLDGKDRLAAADLPDHSLILAGASIAAAAGRVAEADATLRRAAANEAAFASPSPRVTLLLARAQVAVEQRDLDAFDEIAAGLAALRLHPRRLLVPLRSIYAYLAYGRLERCRTAAPAHRPAALAAARQAVAQLRTAASSTLLRAHARIAAAYLHQLDGQPRRALAALAKAQPLLAAADAPLVSFEAARLRGYALLALGQQAEATVAAAGALALAVRYDWPHRAQWIRDGFPDADVPIPVPVGARDPTGSPAAYRQRLEAVTALSLAASRILDPDELTRVALDETIRLLAAERAYLFLTDPDGVLHPHLGRDATGADLTDLVGYGSTLVEKVHRDRQPLVVTGTDEGAALGSRSAVAHGLRSILVAPLEHDDRLLGVLYLDSRVAKGMFTAADLGVLAAITAHIAAALHAARAAELAAKVHELDARVRQMQRLDSLGQLAGGIAHDFNNLLGIIGGFTELLRGELTGDSRHRYLVDQIAATVDKGAGLTRQLLEFGRGQAAEAAVYDLCRVVAELAPMLQRLLGEHIELRTPPPDASGCLVRVDRGQLEQVVVNLAANARDAMSAGGELRLEAEHALLDVAELGTPVPPGTQKRWFVRLAVTDTGTGMDVETLARACEPFFTTKPPARGTGLGLASVYGIVRNAGGLVRLHSEPGRGTTVDVYLPAHGM